jgi:hypothetical protein
MNEEMDQILCYKKNLMPTSNKSPGIPHRKPRKIFFQLTAGDGSGNTVAGDSNFFQNKIPWNAKGNVQVRPCRIAAAQKS